MALMMQLLYSAASDEAFARPRVVDSPPVSRSGGAANLLVINGSKCRAVSVAFGRVQFGQPFYKSPKHSASDDAGSQYSDYIKTPPRNRRERSIGSRRSTLAAVVCLAPASSSAWIRQEGHVVQRQVGRRAVALRAQ